MKTSAIQILLLDHKLKPKRLRALEHWRKIVPEENLCLAWGGARQDFEQLEYSNKIFIDDSRLRVNDLQRDNISYTRTLKTVHGHFSDKEYDVLLYLEGDCFPYRRDVLEYYLGFLMSRRVDVGFTGLKRIDGTNHPHYLYLKSNTKLEEWLSSISYREDKSIVLKSIGCPLLFKRKALEVFCEYDEPFPIHSEEYFPTLMHHLGFHVANIPHQDAYSFLSKDNWTRTELMSACVLHPVKDYWGQLPFEES